MANELYKSQPLVAESTTYEIQGINNELSQETGKLYVTDFFVANLPAQDWRKKAYVDDLNHAIQQYLKK